MRRLVKASLQFSRSRQQICRKFSARGCQKTDFFSGFFEKKSGFLEKKSGFFGKKSGFLVPRGQKNEGPSRGSNPSCPQLRRRRGAAPGQKMEAEPGNRTLAARKYAGGAAPRRAKKRSLARESNPGCAPLRGSQPQLTAAR